jgi:hypothetical protein
VDFFSDTITPVSALHTITQQLRIGQVMLLLVQGTAGQCTVQEEEGRDTVLSVQLSDFNERFSASFAVTGAPPAYAQTLGDWDAGQGREGAADCVPAFLLHLLTALPQTVLSTQQQSKARAHVKNACDKKLKGTTAKAYKDAALLAFSLLQDKPMILAIQAERSSPSHTRLSLVRAFAPPV